ncbi:MAG: hypothetical protein M1825_006367 [Sarcosagium campestre]|nr:MAG: hypothetical protein M1825_006367 [Sarcosagium campestre]
MATEQAPYTVNGNHVNPGSQAAGNGDIGSSFGSQTAVAPTAPASDHISNNNNTNDATTPQDAPKDEVEWQFIKYYYTTLGRNPDNLHLFYNKRSQFLSGVEAEIVPVSAGRNSIMERIKELDFQNCKVCLSNVDFQSSFNNIVIQVIGEMSNKSAPHRKFVQTFVLAEQPNGYFVLNDIFRYLNEEEEDEAEPQDVRDNEASKTQTAPKQQTAELDEIASSVPVTKEPQPQEAVIVDGPVEQKAPTEPSSIQEAQPEPHPPATFANGTAEATVGETGAATTSSPGDTQDKVTSPSETQTKAPIIGDTKSEKAAEDDSTPASTPASTTAAATPSATSQAPAKPAGQRTWANLVALSGSAAPPAPSSSASASPAPQTTRPSAPSSQASESPAPQTQPNTSAGWQLAGKDEYTKRQGRPSPSSAGGEKEVVSAYVKSVTEKVPSEALKSALQKFGELVYFDISRQKNCAFVDFANSTGYNAAVAANPHQIAGEYIYVEERRPRMGAFGGMGYNANRGSFGRGRPGPDGRPGSQGRGGFQKDGGRGSYGPNRGRGGTVTPRGRGISSAG